MPGRYLCQKPLRPTLWQRGARAEAIEQLDLALQQSGGQDAELLVQQGAMYLGEGQINAAARRAEEAIRVDGRLADAWALRGRVFRRNGRLQEALDNSLHALSYQPDLETVQLEVAEIYRQLGRPQRALATLHRLSGQYDSDEVPQQVLYLQGLACQELGRPDDAAHALRRASERGPPSSEIMYRLAEAELQAGRLTGARRAAQEALALTPNREPVEALLARIDQAQQSLQETIRR